MTHQDELKQLVGQEAVKFIENNTIVGLGTGSTVKFMVDALGQRVKTSTFQLSAYQPLSELASRPTVWVFQLRASMKLTILI